MVGDIYVGNTDSLFFSRIAVVFVFFQFFLVVGCLSHDLLEGVRPPRILGLDFLDVPSQRFNVDCRFLVKDYSGKKPPTVWRVEG